MPKTIPLPQYTHLERTLNAKKTKGLPLNVDSPAPLHTADGTEIEWVEDFKYLGSWVESTEKDISVRRALAW